MVEVYSHQSSLEVETELLEKFQHLCCEALPHVLEEKVSADAPLVNLENVEVSIVDDATIAQVHVDFMDIPGATDVITFHHGEIIVSVDTAISHAVDYKHSWQRELFLYMLHGLLHLAGHEDDTEEVKQRMEKAQFRLLEQFWPVVGESC